MDYIAALRGRKALVVTVIVLAAVFAINAIVRFSVASTLHMAPSFADLSHMKGSVTTHKVLPNGEKETIIVNKALGRRVAIVDRGYRGTIVHATSPVTKKPQKIGRSSGPLFTDRKSIDGKSYVEDMRFGGATDFGFFWYAALVVGFVLATVLSGTFSSENDGHLEMSFMRPQSRVHLAIRAIATDILTILLAELATVVFALAMVAVYIEVRPTLSGSTLAAILLNLLAPIAWYAMLLAMTASLRGGRGLVVGLAWPLAFIAPAAFSGTAGNVLPIWKAVHVLLVPLVRLDPLWFMQHFSITPKTVTFGVTLGNAVQPPIAGLATLALLYFGIAVLQWRRMEA
ncbi:MAG: hypothetical protein ACP5O6_06420 [Candidatus Baltobacteraceae bacterium]